MKKKLLSAFLAFCFLLALFPVPTRAATIVASGTCGAVKADDLIWTLDENGLLTFIGSGAMKDYNASSTAPWRTYKGQIKSVTIPSGVTHIGSYAFHEYYSCLTSVTMADSVKSIGEAAFYGAALHFVTLSNSLTSIGYSAFCRCSELEFIGDNSTGFLCLTLPDSVTEIGKYAFSGCSTLTDVDLKEGVVSIGDGAFYQCSGLSALTIPGSVTEIGANAFSSCPNLTVTVYNGSYGQRYCLLNSVRHNAIDPATYTITFHPNGGDGSPTTKTLTGIDNVYGEMPTPTRDGYAFMGWHTATEGGDKITSETEFSPRRNQTLYAVWAKMYAVTFDPNGGEIATTGKTLTDNDDIYGELPTPTRDGYTFTGWFTATDGGDEITPDTKFDPKRAQTLYAVWEKIVPRYTVTLEANGGSVEPSSVTVSEGGTYGELPTPTRRGCNSLGWFTEPSGGTQITPETEVRLTADQTLYAHWRATNVPEISKDGEAITNAGQISAGTDTELDGSLIVVDAANPEAFYTATAFCAVYDASGMMVHLQTWEMDVSDPKNICFTGNVHIPAGVEVSVIKIMVLSDNLVPLQASGML